MCGECACGFGLICLSVVCVMYCVMVHGLGFCVSCVCVAVSFTVLVCGVGGVLVDVVWVLLLCACFVSVFVCCVCLTCV